MTKKTAIILFNLGGPSSPEGVKRFLFNLFNDKAIISIPQPFRFLLAKLISKKRAPIAKKIYSYIGGKSPLLDLTNSQAYNLEKELSYNGDFKVFVAMRYFEPFSDEVVKDLENYQPNEIILLPLYPQFSSSTSDSSIADFLKKFNKNYSKKDEVKIKTICCYPEEEDFINAHALLIRQNIAEYLEEDNLQDFRFLFSAHGLPEKIIKKGDPYVFQVEKTTKKIVEKLAKILGVTEKEIDFKVCFQSKVGPLKWTEPSLESEIRRVANDKKNPVIIPVAFVSEHSETLVELDIEYKEIADELGIEKYIRVNALNSHGDFIKSLANMCRKVTENNADYFVAGENIRICPKKFKLCRNPNICEIS